MLGIQKPQSQSSPISNISYLWHGKTHPYKSTQHREVQPLADFLYLAGHLLWLAEC